MAPKFCQSCGAALPEGAAACPQCGQAVQPPAARPAGVPQRPAGPIPKPSSGLATASGVLMIVANLFAFLMVIAVIASGRHLSNDEAVVVGLATMAWMMAGIAALIVYLIWMYKTWDAVPEQYRGGTSPGKAIGFLFIPFYNLYWIFRAVAGLSKSIQRALLAQNPQSTDGAGFGIGLAACIMSVIPYVNMLAFILLVIWVFMVNGAKNRMLKGLKQG
ncbi:MAG: DUF4328 domain-containing protein [Planctomycetes bacterium]|nr:DUF4328 domain-containing protein [Planctomycetota bacterium]